MRKNLQELFIVKKHFMRKIFPEETVHIRLDYFKKLESEKEYEKMRK